jgi:hypothetical protein
MPTRYEKEQALRFAGIAIRPHPKPRLEISDSEDSAFMSGSADLTPNLT